MKSTETKALNNLKYRETWSLKETKIQKKKCQEKPIQTINAHWLNAMNTIDSAIYATQTSQMAYTVQNVPNATLNYASNAALKTEWKKARLSTSTNIPWSYILQRRGISMLNMRKIMSLHVKYVEFPQKVSATCVTYVILMPVLLATT